LTKEYDKAKTKGLPSKGINKQGIFAPSSPAQSKVSISSSSTGRKPNLRPTDTGMDMLKMYSYRF
jgi:hypothetical protein